MITTRATSCQKMRQLCLMRGSFISLLSFRLLQYSVVVSINKLLTPYLYWCVYDNRAITRNEELYPEPEQFKPERFWGKMDFEAARQVDAVFGFGRRVCPGKAFAESSIFLIMSNIIATMDLTKAVDEAGVPITPSVEYTKSFIR